MSLGPKAAAFLAAYRTCGQVGKACETAGCTRHLHHRMLRTSPAYADAFELAQTELGSIYQDEATRRGVDGIDKVIYFQGFPCGTEREYSDACLLALLRGAMPGKFNSKRVDHVVTGAKGGPIQVDSYGLSRLSETELKALLAIQRKLAKPEAPPQ